MEINDFSELSNFIADENLKIQENYGVQKLSDKMIEFSEKNILKYAKLYDKPLYKKEQRKIALQMAIDTMPHGFLWKIFHWDLWQKIKPIKKTKKVSSTSLHKEQPQTLYPDIVRPAEVPRIIEDDEE